MSLVLAIDIGFKNTGLALFEYTSTGLKLLDTAHITTDHIKKSSKKSVALTDVEKTMFLAKRLEDYIRGHGVNSIVVELPTGGARSSRAVRKMGIASAVIATLAVSMRLVAEWTTPREGKLAATSKPDADKDEMMAAMGKIYPQIAGIPKCRREHIADACAAMHAQRTKDSAQRASSQGD